MTTDLYLIRHGEAYSNAEGVIEGESCRGLTERGMAQARALAARLATGEIPADVLYASTLARARTTAELVSEALKLPVRWTDELHELRPGQADGWHSSELPDRYPEIAQFITQPFAPFAPGGESWGAFQARVSAALEEIIYRHPDERIVIVAHGGVIEVSFLYLLGLGPDAKQRAAFHARNTAITHWRRAVGYRSNEEWQLIVHNDHRHLDGIK